MDLANTALYRGDGDGDGVSKKRKLLFARNNSPPITLIEALTEAKNIVFHVLRLLKTFEHMKTRKKDR